jgi:lipoprotein-anchoring transpeptidase ErfK/SrfK
MAATLALSGVATAQRVNIRDGSVTQTIPHLRTGQFVWAPQIAPEGQMSLTIDLSTQRAVLFRSGVPIAASTISTGRKGRETPTGVFTILEKQVVHHSRTYDNASMPYMQRLTRRGVSMHAGKLPGYPASHGCIRLPPSFAKLLYGVTSTGMTVVITESSPSNWTAPREDVSSRAVAESRPGDGL